MPDLVKFMDSTGRKTVAINPEYVVAVRDDSAQGIIRTIVRTTVGIERLGEKIDQVLKKLDNRRKAIGDG